MALTGQHDGDVVYVGMRATFEILGWNMDQVGEWDTVENWGNGLVEQNQMKGEEISLLILLMYCAADDIFGDQFVRFYIIWVHS